MTDRASRTHDERMLRRRSSQRLISPGYLAPSLPGLTGSDEGEAAGSRDIGRTMAGVSVGGFIVASMIVGSAMVALLASLVALAVSVISPFTGMIALAFAAPLARPLVIPAPGIYVAMAAAMLFGVILRLPIERPRLRWPSPEVVLLGAFLVYVTSHVLGGRLVGDVGQSGEVIRSSFARLTEGVMTFGVAHIVLRGRSPYPVLAALLFSALLGSIVAISQIVGAEGFFGDLIKPTEVLGRITGTFVDPNYFGAYLAAMITLAVASAVNAQAPRLRLGLLALAVPLSVALAFTQSRGAIAALLAGLIAIAFTRSRRAGLVATGILVIVTAIGYPAFSEWRFGDNADAVAGNVSADALTAGRAGAWFSGADLFASSPLFGVGFGQFRDESSVGIAAHNWYVQVLAELGIAGFALWALFTAAILLALRRKSKPARAVGYPVLVVWMVAGLSLAPPTAFEVTGPVLIIVAAASVAVWVPGEIAARATASGGRGPERPRLAVTARSSRRAGIASRPVPRQWPS